MLYVDAIKLYDRAIRGSNPAKQSSLHAWHERTKLRRAAFQKLQAESNAELAKARERYSDKVYLEKENDEKKTMEAVLKYVRGEIMEDFNSVIDAKRYRFQKAMSAPSDEQLRLLQTLNLRDDLTSQEIALTAENFADNIQAMLALAAIARRNNIDFPSIPSAADFEDDIQRVTELAEKACDKIGTGELNYMSRLFFETETVGLEQPSVDRLDDTSYFALQRSDFRDYSRAQIMKEIDSTSAGGSNATDNANT